MKKRSIAIVVAAAFCLTACGGGSGSSNTNSGDSGGSGSDTENAAPAQGTYTLNIGSAMNPTNPSTIALQSFKEAVEERTNGDLVVNIYTDSALGGEADLLEQVTSGTVEGMIQMGAANWEPYNSEVNVALLPFLFTSIDSARAARAGSSDVAEMAFMEP